MFRVLSSSVIYTLSLQKEIEVLMNEIFIPMLEMRTSTTKQKSVLLQMLSRLSQDAQALVDLYINYDCDSEAQENIYERYDMPVTPLCLVLT
jgi:brefeldin A-inhibited guanine nucleotide-exchange protein